MNKKRLTCNLCFKACPFGMFGGKCSQICGRCLSNVTCNPVNGKCSGGCDEGCMGSYCDTRMFKKKSRLFLKVSEINVDIQ